MLKTTIHSVSVLAIVLAAAQHLPAEEKSSSWRKHTIYSGQHCNTAVAADFTGDGKIDVICCVGGKTLLLVAPNWRQIVIEGERKINAIHSGSAITSAWATSTATEKPTSSPPAVMANSRRTSSAAIRPPTTSAPSTWTATVISIC